MAEPYLGEIRLFPFATVPSGWALCQGQLLNIQGNQALFSLIGNQYGGDGKINFALPDLRGRVPISVSINPSDGVTRPGITGGLENVTLNINQIPAHSHQLFAAMAAANATSPSNALPAQTQADTTLTIYQYAPYSSSQVVPMATTAISTTGGNAHTNMQPYMALNFCIAITGFYPQRP